MTSFVEIQRSDAFERTERLFCLMRGRFCLHDDLRFEKDDCKGFRI